MITNDINIALINERDGVARFINSNQEEDLLKNNSNDLQSLKEGVDSVEKTSGILSKIFTMIDAFDNPRGEIKLYAGWFKQLVTHIKKNPVHKGIWALANTIINSYERLSLAIEKKSNEDLNKYYQNATKFFYLLNVESKKNQFSKVNYLEISNKFVSRWAEIAMTEKERIKYCLTSAKVHLDKEHNILALAKINEGLKISSNYAKLHEKLLNLKNILDFESKPERKQKRKKVENPKVYHLRRNAHSGFSS